jgi:hypothetical protein
LLLKKAIFTASMRRELSDRPYYSSTNQTLETKHEKNETFLGVQVVANKNIMVGMFYNYYLMREYSLGLTAFF